MKVSGSLDYRDTPFVVLGSYCSHSRRLVEIFSRISVSFLTSSEILSRLEYVVMYVTRIDPTRVAVVPFLRPTHRHPYSCHRPYRPNLRHRYLPLRLVITAIMDSISSPASFALTRSLTHFLRHNQPPLLFTYLAQVSGKHGRLVCYESVFLQVLHSIGVSQCLLIYLHRLKGFPLLLINVAQAVEKFEPSLIVQNRFIEVL